MANRVRSWAVSCSKEGFALKVVEKKRLGVFLEWMIEFLDLGWWGRYKTIPFNWTNPWVWTYRIGTEKHNLGFIWLDMSSKIQAWIHDKQDENVLTRFPVSKEQLKKDFTQTWEWWSEMFEEDDE